MHAIRLHEFGPADNLRWEEVDDPEPGPAPGPRRRQRVRRPPPRHLDPARALAAVGAGELTPVLDERFTLARAAEAHAALEARGTVGKVVLVRD